MSQHVRTVGSDEAVSCGDDDDDPQLLQWEGLELEAGLPSAAPPADPPPSPAPVEAQTVPHRRERIAEIRRRLGLTGVVREKADEDVVALELADDVAPLVDDNVDAVAPEGFFERSAPGARAADSFRALGLSRMLLRATSACGWTRPSAVQAAVVPIALEGRDLCVSAETGSGKTGAFALPALERLQLRPPGGDAAVRVLVLVPTRELALQCDSVFEALSQGSGVTRALCVGGTNVRMQEAELRARPDVVIGTPGRLVDLLLNAPDFGLEDVEVLVLDEADRLLDMGFKEQLHELVRHCPRRRQTLLFSATMSENVEQLAAVSLQRPVRVAMPMRDSVVGGLRQEFVRVRAEEETRLFALVLYLLAGPVASQQTIVFVGRKKAAHRLALLVQIAGHSCSELHGNMTQADRARAMEEFRAGDCRVLVATDLASRGLDVPAVDAVINAHMPAAVNDYVHRVGRTARAGRSGLAVSLVLESDRPLVKAIVKEGISDAVRRRVPADRVRYWHDEIARWNAEIQTLYEHEGVDMALQAGEREAARAENMVTHANEIMARPKRAWVATKKEKKAGGKAAKAEGPQMTVRERKRARAKEVKGDQWVPEEEMEVRRKAKRAEMAAATEAARQAAAREPVLFEYRDEHEEAQRRAVADLGRAAKAGSGERHGAKRALVAQKLRAKDESKKMNAHRHERKETFKKGGFKSLGKYKRR